MLACLVAFVGAASWVKSPFALVVFLVYLLATELPARRAGRGTPGSSSRWRWPSASGAWPGSSGSACSAPSPRRARWQDAPGAAVREADRGEDGQGRGSGLLPGTTLRDFGPLLLLPVAAGVLAFRNGWRLSRHDIVCLAVWALAAPVLATASASKLPWYTYLSYPGIALLLAVSAQSLSERKSVQAADAGSLRPGARVADSGRRGVAWGGSGSAASRGGSGRSPARTPRSWWSPGPEFELPRGRDDAYREARLFIRTLFWKQTQTSPGPDPCRATLVNRLRDMPGAEEWDVLELHRPENRRRGSGLWMIDGCNGWLREQLAVYSDP